MPCLYICHDKSRNIFNYAFLCKWKAAIREIRVLFCTLLNEIVMEHATNYDQDKAELSRLAGPRSVANLGDSLLANIVLLRVAVIVDSSLILTNVGIFGDKMHVFLTLRFIFHYFEIFPSAVFLTSPGRKEHNYKIERLCVSLVKHSMQNFIHIACMSLCLCVALSESDLSVCTHHNYILYFAEFI